MARPFLSIFSTLATAIVIMSANASLDNKVGPVMEEIVIDVDPAEGEQGNVLEEERSQRDLNNIGMGEENAGGNPGDIRIREFHKVLQVSVRLIGSLSSYLFTGQAKEICAHRAV